MKMEDFIAIERELSLITEDDFNRIWNTAMQDFRSLYEARRIAWRWFSTDRVGFMLWFPGYTDDLDRVEIKRRLFDYAVKALRDPGDEGSHAPL